MVHIGMWAKTTIGVLLERALKIVFQPGQLVGAKRAQAARLEVHDIDQGR